MKLAAVLACRNQSARLYAKPLQNLNVEKNISILDHLVGQLKLRAEIDNVVLAISEQKENEIYLPCAERYAIPHVLGDDDDVLGRLIAGAECVGADHVLRVTSESPYPYLDDLPEIYALHCEKQAAFSANQGLPDGSFYEIISVEALKKCWDDGGQDYRNELCTRYIFDNKEKFEIINHEVPEALRRLDIRLTVDWPEDLIVLRKVYEELALSPDTPHALSEIVRYLDAHPEVNQINNWIDSGIGRIWY